MNQVQALRKQNFVKAKPILLIVAAQRCNVLRLILRKGIGLALIGILIGTAGALVVTQSLRSPLFLVKPNEPWALAGTSLLLFAVALLACWFPARRAPRVDPTEGIAL